MFGYGPLGTYAFAAVIGFLVLYYVSGPDNRQHASMDAARLEAKLPGGRWDSVEEIPSVQAAAQLAARDVNQHAASAHSCRECVTDWGKVMQHDETMDIEKLNYCPECGSELPEEEPNV